MDSVGSQGRAILIPGGDNVLSHPAPEFYSQCHLDITSDGLVVWRLTGYSNRYCIHVCVCVCMGGGEGKWVGVHVCEDDINQEPPVAIDGATP